MFILDIAYLFFVHMYTFTRFFSLSIHIGFVSFFFGQRERWEISKNEHNWRVGSSASTTLCILMLPAKISNPPDPTRASKNLPQPCPTRADTLLVGSDRVGLQDFNWLICHPGLVRSTRGTFALHDGSLFFCLAYPSCPELGSSSSSHAERITVTDCSSASAPATSTVCDGTKSTYSSIITRPWWSSHRVVFWSMSVFSLNDERRVNRDSNGLEIRRSSYNCGPFLDFI